MSVSECFFPLKSAQNDKSGYGQLSSCGHNAVWNRQLNPRPKPKKMYGNNSLLRNCGHFLWSQKFFFSHGTTGNLDLIILQSWSVYLFVHYFASKEICTAK